MKTEIAAKSQFFSAKTLGKDLQEVAVDVIQTQQDHLVSRWFHGESGVDLFIWSDSNKTIIKQQICFHGQIVEWNCLDGVRTGWVKEDEVALPQKTEAGNQQSNSETAQFDKEPQQKCVEMAVEIILSMAADPNIHLQLVNNFKNPQTIATLNPKAFLDRFGFALKNYQKQDHGFWENLKQTLGQIFKK